MSATVHPAGLRVLVCGGRGFNDRGLIWRTLDALHAERGIDLIIEGGASGADHFASLWSKRRDLDHHLRVSADWVRWGNAAGPDLVVAFLGGRGTADMVRRARAAGVKVIEVEADV